MTIENNAPLLMPYYPPGGEMRSRGKYEPRTSPDPGEQFGTPRWISGAPGHDPGEGSISPFSGAQYSMLEHGDPRGESPGSPMEKPRLQAHRS
ncbi:hypothetical protein ES703_35970 [subsurface metagenome]